VVVAERSPGQLAQQVGQAEPVVGRQHRLVDPLHAGRAAAPRRRGTGFEVAFG
jgi:hypothetical protein